MGYYVRTKSGLKGPFETDKIQALLDAGKLKETTKLQNDLEETFTVAEALALEDSFVEESYEEVYEDDGYTEGYEEGGYEEEVYEEVKETRAPSRAPQRGARKGGGAPKRGGARSAPARPLQPQESGGKAFLKGLAIKAGGFVVVIMVLIGVKFCNMSSDSSDVEKEARQLVATFPGYSEHKAYYNRLLDRFHASAFNAAYDMGGRRRGSSFDANRYVASLLSKMANQARRDGKEEVGAILDLARGVNPMDKYRQPRETGGRAGPPGS